MPYDWKIELNSTDISDKVSRFSVLCNINNFCREMTLDIADPDLYSSLDFSQISESPEIEIFTKVGDSFVSQGTFFIERPNIASTINSDLMQGVWGRSLTALLAEPFAPKVTKAWETQTTFFAVCQEMCDLAGFTWNSAYSDISDFVIFPYTYEAEGIYPIDVIAELAMLAGALITTDRSGHLCIKQIDYAPSAADVTVTDDDITEIAESPEWPVFANRLRITPTGSIANYTIEMIIPNKCLHADASSKTRLFTQVRDQEGEPVNGLVVDWADDSDTATLSYTETNTQEVLVQNERQQATGFYTVNVDIPPDSVDGIWAYSDPGKTTNLASGGYSISGNTITLTDKLAYCDQSLVISYRADGMAVNYLQAGPAADDVTVTADVEGQQATDKVYIENPCQCPPSIRLTAAPTSMVKNEAARLLVYVEESGPVAGRMVFMSEASETRKGSLDWTSARLGQVNIKNEKTPARNEIAGISQCEISMFPASVISVYQDDGTGNPTGSNLYSSHDGKTIDLSSSVATGTDLLVTYIAQGAALNLFTGSAIGRARITASIMTTSEEASEDSADIQITDNSEITDDYPAGWSQGDDDGGYGGAGGSNSFDFDTAPSAVLCTQTDGTRVECGDGERCCSDGFTTGCHPSNECVGGDIDPCYPAGIEGEPNDAVLASRFDTGLEYDCTCQEMCAKEFDVYETTQDYDDASGRKISEIVVDDYGYEEGTPEYWEKYAELKAEALSECEDQCACASGMEWDTGSNPETIVAGTSIGLSVLNGLGPYKWSISGEGYSLISEETVTGMNTLSCVSGDCGVDYDPSAEITVTDACGNTVTGYVRNTSGGWPTYEVDLCCSEESGCSDGRCTNIFVIDNKIIAHQISSHESCSGSPDCLSCECEDVNYEYCATDYGESYTASLRIGVWGCHDQGGPLNWDQTC